MHDLEQLYLLYNSIVQDILKNPRATDEMGKRVTVDGEMYKALVSYYHFNDFPTVVSDEKYQKLEGDETYHGFTDFDHGAQLLSHFNYNLGTGGYTPGLFFTSNREAAVWYTNHEANDLEEDENRVLAVKMKSDAKTMKFDKLQDLMISPSFALPPDVKQEYAEKIKDLYDFADHLKAQGKYAAGFVKTMKKLSNFAVYLGLDYVFEEDYEHTIIFNRGSMVVSEEEVRKFTAASKHYKDGAYDFHDRVNSEDNQDSDDSQKQ